MKISTKKTHRNTEYDFSGGVRGKYADRYAQGTNVILLEPDVAKIFPTTESVNRSLRALAVLFREHGIKKAV